MPMYMSGTTEQIKERLGIVDVVSSYIKLEKAGSNFKANCPFHHEKTPSFFVSPTRNTFYCFGCGEKGDIFSFVERFEGVDFPGALKMLGERAGVAVVFENQGDKNARNRLYELLENSTNFFEENLKENKRAIKYLHDRGVDDNHIKKFRIGYVKDEWSTLYNHLKERGFTDEEMVLSGVAIKKDGGGIYDRFRGRIMFPITDSTGRIIAYSGRIFNEGKEAAKYINSPETELYNKSKVLYGLDKAKLSIRKSNFAIVVEGQMDVVMSHKAGYTNTVALSGTALTLHQVTQLKRLSNNVVFALDSDTAGVASSGRSADMALGEGMDVKVAKIPDGVDPADLVKDNPENLKVAVRNAVHIIDFYLENLSKGEKDKRKLNRKVEEIVLPFIARIPSRIDQMHFISEVARRLGLPEDVVRDEVAQIPDRDEAQSEDNMTQVEEKKSLTKKEAIRNKLLGIIFSEAEKKDGADLEKVKEQLREIIGEKEYESLSKKPEEFEEETLFMVEAGYENEEKLLIETEVLLRELKIEFLQDKNDVILMKLREAENAQNEEQKQNCLIEFKRISEAISNLKLNRGEV
jgi:DNA primase